MNGGKTTFRVSFYLNSTTTGVDRLATKDSVLYFSNKETCKVATVVKSRVVQIWGTHIAKSRLH